MEVLLYQKISLFGRIFITLIKMEKELSQSFEYFNKKKREIQKEL
jgi:hypothetical protein